MEERSYDEKTCIIVVKMKDTQIGLIVDTVYEVMDIPKNNIEPPPRMHIKINEQYIMGIGKVDKQITILLDLTSLLYEQELAEVGKLSQRA